MINHSPIEKLSFEELQKTFEPKPIRTMDLPRQVTMARYSPCGCYLFCTGYDATIRRWDLKKLPEAKTDAKAKQQQEPSPEADLLENQHHGWVTGLEFDKEGERFFTVDSWGKLICWKNFASPKVLWSHEQAHDGWIRSFSLSDDGTKIVTAGRDRKVRLWSNEGKMLSDFPPYETDIYSLCLTPEKDRILIGDLMGRVTEWMIDTGKLLRTFDLKDYHYQNNIQDVCGLRILKFLQDRKTLLIAGATPTKTGRMLGTAMISLMDFASGKLEQTLKQGIESEGYVFDVTEHSLGFFLSVTSGSPGTGQLLAHRASDKKPFLIYKKNLSNPHSLSMHPDVDLNRFVVASTNRQSQGNGAVKDKEGNYLGNYSQITFFEWQTVTEEKKS